MFCFCICLLWFIASVAVHVLVICKMFLFQNQLVQIQHFFWYSRSHVLPHPSCWLLPFSLLLVWLVNGWTGCYCEFKGTDEKGLLACCYVRRESRVGEGWFSQNCWEHDGTIYFSSAISYIRVTLLCVFVVQCFTMYFSPYRLPLSCLRWMFHMI